MSTSPSRVQTNVWVTIQYRLFDSSNEPLEEDDREMTYLHGGYGDIFPQVEQALDGAGLDFQTSLYLQPEDTFGDYNADLIRMTTRSQLPEHLEEGMVFEGVPGESDDGLMYTVTDIADDTVILDGNHPLAGMAVRFDLKVVDLVKATQEEIEAEALRSSGGARPSMLH
jgi:FKBP-type peptidyl-prolyl cis-trans isomerase SlyD